MRSAGVCQRILWTGHHWKRSWAALGCRPSLFDALLELLQHSVTESHAGLRTQKIKQQKIYSRVSRLQPQLRKLMGKGIIRVFPSGFVKLSMPFLHDGSFVSSSTGCSTGSKVFNKARTSTVKQQLPFHTDVATWGHLK